MTPWKNFVPYHRNLKNQLLKVFYATRVGQSFRNYLKKIKPLYTYESSVMPILKRSPFDIIYLIIYPFVIYFTVKASFSYKFGYELAIPGSPKLQIAKRMRYISLLPSRLFIFKYIRANLRYDVSLKRYTYMCCGYSTLRTMPSSTAHEICKVCLWQGDPLQSANPEMEDGLNEVSLIQAKRNFQVFEASQMRFKYDARRA
jgi:Cysteine-rich CPCC